METTSKRHNFTLYVRGVYGRNRSEKATHVRIFALPEGAAEPDTAAVDAAVAAALSDLRVKRVRWYVNREPVDVTRYSDGVEIEKFALFSGVRIAAGEVGL